MLCPSLLLVLPPTGTDRSIVVVTMQGFHRHELKIKNSDKAPVPLLAFQLLAEVLQACVLKSRFGLSWSQCHFPTVISIPEGAAVGGRRGVQ